MGMGVDVCVCVCVCVGGGGGEVCAWVCVCCGFRVTGRSGVDVCSKCVAGRWGQMSSPSMLFRSGGGGTCLPFNNCQERETNIHPYIFLLRMSNKFSVGHLTEPLLIKVS